MGGRVQSQDAPNLSLITTKHVCPLSDQQTQNAIQAFARMVPVFLHKRCANCHGGLDPFKADHPEGPHTREEMTTGGCNECHSDLPRGENGHEKMWTLPFPGHEFVGKDGPRLCKMMRTSFFKPEDFLAHLHDENGRTNFQAVAFLGTRGLNEYGQGFAFTKPYRPEPIDIMGPDEFDKAAASWVKAMGGKFQGDIRCGCEPVNYDVKVSYDATINAGPLQLKSKMGPVNVPITFHENGAYEGTGTLPFSADGEVDACSGQSLGSMQIKVSGTAVEEGSTNDMKVVLTNTTPVSGATGVECPGKSFSAALKGGDKMTFRFQLAGKDGDWSEAPVQLGPVVDAKVRVDLVDHDPRKSPASE